MIQLFAEFILTSFFISVSGVTPHVGLVNLANLGIYHPIP